VRNKSTRTGADQIHIMTPKHIPEILHGIQGADVLSSAAKRCRPSLCVCGGRGLMAVALGRAVGRQLFGLGGG
jgi:hypothetical protein